MFTRSKFKFLIYLFSYHDGGGAAKILKSVLRESGVLVFFS